jgi:imidazoleglycerol-phosphate dehydratase/histidinol-phosphatase
MKRALFIDRDGTIILEPADHQIDSLEKLEFYPGVIHALRSLAQSNQYELIMVTNQDGLGTTSFPEETFWPAHSKMMKTLEGEGVLFTKVHIDKSLPAENKPTRKPGTGMLQEYLQGNYDLANSYVIGDRFTDIESVRTAHFAKYYHPITRRYYIRSSVRHLSSSHENHFKRHHA